MSKEELPPQFNPDTTQQAHGMFRQLTADVTRNFGEFVVEGAQTLSTLELVTPDRADEITATAIDQYEWSQRTFTYVEDMTPMSESEISTSLDTTSEAFAGSYDFITATKLLNAEVLEFSAKDPDFVLPPDSLYRRLLDQGEIPYRSMSILYLLAHSTTIHARNIVEYSAHSVLLTSAVSRLGSQQPKPNRIEAPLSLDNINLKAVQEQIPSGAHTLEGAEYLLTLLAEPATRKEIKYPDLIRPIILAYRGWQKVRKALPENGVYAHRFRFDSSKPPLSKKPLPIKPPVKPAAELIKEREAELATLLEQHKAHTASFRPSWSQLQKAGFRTLSNKLQTMSELGSNIPSKRLTSLLTVLARSGQVSDYGESRIRQILVDEQRLEPRITTLFADLQINKRDRNERWQPVADDLALLAHNWDAIKPHVVYLWPKDGAAAAASIKVSLDAFQKVKQELEQVESASQSGVKE